MGFKVGSTVLVRGTDWGHLQVVKITDDGRPWLRRHSDGVVISMVTMLDRIVRV